MINNKTNNSNENQPPKVDIKYKKEFIGNAVNNYNEIASKVDEHIRKIDEKNKKAFKIQPQKLSDTEFNEDNTLYYEASSKTRFRFDPGFFILFLPIIILLLFIGSLVYGEIDAYIKKRENSQRLLMYRFQESADRFYAHRIIDPSLVMTPEIESEIMRIKREIDNELTYGKSDRLSNTWLYYFDGDGNNSKADCDDFAFLFWEKSQMSELLKDKIFFAVSDDDIFAHAFNLIWIDGEWHAIEPQDLKKALGFSYAGYVGITEDVFKIWLKKQQVIIFDVGNMNHARAIVPLLNH
ncbi:MAG: hypothetical protein LBG94_10475 [Treponema sp.]|jgi:hypothetical protein|nr:hypothetical protein [Treponema sp.]